MFGDELQFLLPLLMRPHFNVDKATGNFVGSTPEKPGEYPAATGAHYHGDMPGWSYDPYTDSYIAPRKAQSSYEQAQGIAPPQLSPWEQILPYLGAASLMGGLGGGKG